MNAGCRTSFLASEEVVYQIVAFCQRPFSKNLRDVVPRSCHCLNFEVVRALGVFSRTEPNMFGWVWSAPFPRGPRKGPGRGLWLGCGRSFDCSWRRLGGGDRVLRPILVALASSALGAAEGLGSAAAIEAAGPLLACGEARRTNGKESRNYS